MDGSEIDRKPGLQVRYLVNGELKIKDLSQIGEKKPLPENDTLLTGDEQRVKEADRG